MQVCWESACPYTSQKWAIKVDSVRSYSSNQQTKNSEVSGEAEINCSSELSLSLPKERKKSSKLGSQRAILFCVACTSCPLIPCKDMLLTSGL